VTDPISRAGRLHPRVLAVPVKSPSASKTRLAGVLSPAERAGLTAALLEDVLDACLAQEGWETWVISPDQSTRRIARQRGARPLVERGDTLLKAVRQVEEAAGTDSGALAVVLGDLPYLTTAELSVALAADGPVVAAPAASDGGTNLLLRRPPSVIRARFGRASFAKHRWAARRAGLVMAEVRSEGLEHDLDRPEDLARLVASGHPGRTLSACIAMGLPSRLMLDSVATKG
jgi:2-phospho-L-lactate guanylyltransferase